MFTDGHIQLRRGLYPHIKKGRMTLDELAVYVYLHFIADFRNGLLKTSAPHIHYETGQTSTIRKIQRILEGLEKKRYIRRFILDGRKGDYQILIHKFQPTAGVWRGKYLNAFKCADYNEFVFEDRVDGGMDDDAESDVHGDVRTGEFVKNSIKNSKEELKEEINQEESDSQTDMTPAASGLVDPSTDDTGEDDMDCIRYYSKEFCKLMNLPFKKEYAADLAPAFKKYGGQMIHDVVKSSTIRSKFWMKDLSSFRQFIWRLGSEGEDSLINQVRQEQNLDKELIRADIKKKLRHYNKSGGIDAAWGELIPKEKELALADTYQETFLEARPARFFFFPLVEQGICPGNIRQILGWALQNQYAAEEDLGNPEWFVYNWEFILRSFQIANGIITEADDAVVANVNVETDEL